MGHTVNPLSFPDVPKKRIAQTPAVPRDSARLMVVDRGQGSWRHETFSAIKDFFTPGDVLVLNEAKVFPARLIGHKPTGGKVQVLLLARLAPKDETEGERWAALVTPLMKEGSAIQFEGGLEAKMVGKRPDGEWEILFSRPLGEDVDRLGRMPLPPYIRREAASNQFEKMDREYYQTVFAKNADDETKCVAAPTAGLHFTQGLLDEIRNRKVEVLSLRLNVGWGTFRPLSSGDYRQHRMLAEEYFLPEQTARLINQAKDAGHRVWAVGTTVVRTLESAADSHGRLYPAKSKTDLFIMPGHKFRVVGGLVTNFHLPSHTPLILTAAFAGADLLRRAYESALAEGYRFFSYGDAMAIM